MKAKHWLTMPFAVSDILISHMLVSVAFTLILYFIMNKNVFPNWLAFDTVPVLRIYGTSK